MTQLEFQSVPLALLSIYESGLTDSLRRQANMRTAGERALAESSANPTA